MICKHIVYKKSQKLYGIAFKNECILKKCNGKEQFRDCFEPFVEEPPRKRRNCMAIQKEEWLEYLKKKKEAEKDEM